MNANYNHDTYIAQIIRGNIPGAQQISAYGRLVTTGAETNHVVWPNGAWAIPPSSGVQMTIVSTSAQDGVGGTGIRGVHIHYLDANLAEQSEILLLDGLTPASTVATDIRFVQCMHMDTYGSSKSAVGDISLSSGGTNYSYIESGAVRCSSSARMVPAGKRLFVAAVVLGMTSGSGAAEGEIRLNTTFFGGRDYSADSVLIPLTATVMQDTTITLSLPVPLTATEGTVIAMTATVNKASTIAAAWLGWTENEGA